MALSLGRAAKAVGRSKSALSRDVKAGRISAVRNPDGSLSIDPSELFRVFPPPAHATGARNGGWDESQPLGDGEGIGGTVRNIAAQQGIDSLQLVQRLAKAEAERDLLLDQVSDLRARLDAEAEERRRLTAVLLTDRRMTPPEPEPEPSPGAAVAGEAAHMTAVLTDRRSWWRRWFR